MKIENSKALVFGLGKSGIGAAGLLIKHGAKVYLYDGNTNVDEKKLKQEQGNDIRIYLGDFPYDIIDELDIAVLSPGVSPELPEIVRMREAGVKISGEIELAYTCSRGDILAVTGTNGKTTTTTLLGEIIKAYNNDTFVVGNIGSPYTQSADATNENSITVAEISSFQLETIDTFKPNVSAILNITPDHLDRHHTMEAYIAAKFRITENQSSEDYCILNAEDALIAKSAERVKAAKIYFSSSRKLDEGIYIEDNNVIYNVSGKYVNICHLDELQVLGKHNYENVMAASAMALVYGVPENTVISVVKAFKGVEHRIEFVAEKSGVAYYNDSKGTNPDAAMKAVGAMKRPTVLIAGGYDKGSSYGDWIKSFQGRVRRLILVGDTKDKIAKEAKSVGFNDIILTDTFEEAVHQAAESARDGEAVLLSPACASWDMFPNYEARGDLFKRIVNSL